MPSEWSLYVRCADCGQYGFPAALRTGTAPACGGATMQQAHRALVCPRCGSVQWRHEPLPGRLVSAAVWWKPWARGRGRWEWREDQKVAWGETSVTAEDAPHA